MKKILVLLMLGFLFVGLSCTPRSHFGVKDKCVQSCVPREFDETEAAIARAERSPGAKSCPGKITGAKELARQGAEAYWAGRTEEGMRLLAEARQMAQAAEQCQPLPPAPSPAAKPTPPPPSPPPPPAPKPEPSPPPPPPAPKPEPSPPAPPPPPKKEISLKRVYFDFNKSTLTRKAKATLNETAKILKEDPEVRLELAGYTDGTGTEVYNKGLSDRRSKAVFDYLASKGIAASRMRAVGYGESNPVASNKTEEGRAKNRRVELRILK